MLEVVTKSEVGLSAVWLLNTSLEDLRDDDDDKIYSNFIYRYYELILFLLRSSMRAIYSV